MIALAQGLAWLVIGGTLLQYLVHLVHLFLAQRGLANERPAAQSAAARRHSAALAPPIALMTPAWNQAETIEKNVLSLLALDYPRFEVVVINDGSTDATLQVLQDRFGLMSVERDYELATGHAPIRGVYQSGAHDRLIVIDKENGGKADALNAGLNVSRSPIVCAMEAGAILEPGALLRAVQPFIEDPERVVAVGGTVRIANGSSIQDGRLQKIGLSRNILALFQTVEYFRAFLLARLAWSRIGALVVSSGAFGLFRRSAVVDMGGYGAGASGEDMDLVVRLHRHAVDTGRPWRTVFLPEPICWTEAPENLKALGRQRSRWQRGAIETLARSRTTITQPNYRHAGLLGLLQVLLFDFIGPVLELTGYVLLPVLWLSGVLSFDYVATFYVLSIFFGIAVSVGALAIEEAELRRVPRVGDLMRLAFAAVLENFGFRQLNAWWRVRGFWQWMLGGRDGTDPKGASPAAG